MLKHTFLDKNLKGRDFIVGDIHGCLNELKAMLTHVNFNENDRLISTGDLIDRGPLNLETLDFFISAPNVYSVKGNHDLYLQCLLTEQSSYAIEHNIQAYTMPWVRKENIATQLETNMKYAFYLNELPIVITVQDENNNPLYHVVHSEFTSDESMLCEYMKYDIGATKDKWKQAINVEKEVIITDEWIAQLKFNHVNQEHDFLIKRDIFYHSEINKQKQTLTYSGHNALMHPVQLGRQVIIDVGMCFHYDSSDIKSPTSKFVPGLCMTEALSPECYIGQYNLSEFSIRYEKIKDFSLHMSVLPN